MKTKLEEWLSNLDSEKDVSVSSAIANAGKKLPSEKSKRGNPLHIVDENGVHDCDEEELKIWRKI